MTLDQVIFALSALVAVFGGVMMITVRNPVAAVLYLILSLVAQAVLYVQLDALFLGAILVIVYAGAIMVLFLFVIMLLNLRGNEDLGPPSPPLARFTRYLVGALLTLELLFLVRSVVLRGIGGGVMAPLPEGFGSIREVAMLLYTDYMFPLQLTGVLLTIAVVGAVCLARRDAAEPPSEPPAVEPAEQAAPHEEVAP